MRKREKEKLEILILEARRHYFEEGREFLPWRATRDPYKVLVSEVMLQQTQVDRVIPYYKKFIRTYPSPQVLSRVSLKNVLLHWQGLGYNRRAKFLHEAAKVITKKGFPKQVEEIEKLPGVGPYTARAVAAFAYNQPTVFVETNIRTVFFYHLGTRGKLSDEDLLPLVEFALHNSGLDPREFYAAMMDYGTYLKAKGIKLNQKSAHYVKQKPFKGSARELRGAIVRELLQHHATLATLSHQIPRSKEELMVELARLAAEGLVSLHGRYFEIKK